MRGGVIDYIYYILAHARSLFAVLGSRYSDLKSYVLNENENDSPLQQLGCASFAVLLYRTM
jgi:hypothetical protein